MQKRQYVKPESIDAGRMNVNITYPVEWMTNRYIIIFIMFIIVIISTRIGLFAQDDAGSRASFTRSGWVGAKYVAMGKAAEVIVDDVYSIYWNPAGLRELIGGDTKTKEICRKNTEEKLEGFTEDDLIKFSEEEFTQSFIQIGASAALLDIEREAGFMGVAFDIFEGVMGIGLYSIQSRDIESRDEAGYFIKDLDYIASVGYISYGWGRGISSIGFSIKGLYEKIGDIGFYGCGVDFGTQMELVPFFKIGLVAQDIGTGLKPNEDYNYIDNRYDFASPTIRLSAAITDNSSDIVIAISGGRRLESSDYELNLGFQYNIQKQTSLYIGLNNLLFSSGISFKLYRVKMSYAFSFDRIDLGYNNIVSITLVL